MHFDEKSNFYGENHTNVKQSVGKNFKQQDTFILTIIVHLFFHIVFCTKILSFLIDNLNGDEAAGFVH